MTEKKKSNPWDILILGDSFPSACLMAGGGTSSPEDSMDRYLPYVVTSQDHGDYYLVTCGGLTKSCIKKFLQPIHL
jgi:hypothetical protein